MALPYKDAYTNAYFSAQIDARVAVTMQYSLAIAMTGSLLREKPCQTTSIMH